MNEKDDASKVAATDAPVLDVIAARWSPRAFADRSVEVAMLRSVFEAARWAPSSMNLQPWSYVVARREDHEAFERLLGCLVEGNRVWAKAAPVLCLSFARARKPGSDALNVHAWHDLGMATAQLALQAVAQGLMVHAMGGILRDVIAERYAIPEGCEVVAALAIGYQGSAESLEEPLRSRELAPRTRVTQENFVFWGEFPAESR